MVCGAGRGFASSAWRPGSANTLAHCRVLLPDLCLLQVPRCWLPQGHGMHWAQGWLYWEYEWEGKWPRGRPVGCGEERPHHQQHPAVRGCGPCPGDIQRQGSDRQDPTL